ncbi:HepT-like ribonuclease domain-containing protein [Synechococcus elongatus]|nr:HepT-like ribonuclease domain-containing protein [Synechococcus elongatus]
MNQCSREDFTTNLQLQDAVIRRLLIIAETAKRISEQARQSLPTIPWQEINGMRNRLVHEYDDINLSIVWNVVETELPVLIQELKALIPPETGTTPL